MKKFLISGGFGFIGSYVVEELFQDENNFIIVVDNMSIGSNKDNISDEIQNSSRFIHYNKDICNDIALNLMFEDNLPDVVLHLAAESHVDRSIINPDGFINTNIIGTHNILKCVKNFDCRLVHVSTDEVYGQLGENDRPFLETDILDPRSPYSASKASSDLLVLSYISTHGINATITRCCNNYGPRQFDEKLIPTIINCLKNEIKIPVYGNGQNIREWIHARDHAKAIIEVSSYDSSTFESSNYIRNIPGKISFTNLDIIRRILDLVNGFLDEDYKFDDVIEFVDDRKGHDYRYEIQTIYKTPLHSVKYQTNFSNGLHDTVKFYINR